MSVVLFDDALRREYLKSLQKLGITNPAIIARCAKELTPEKVDECREAMVYIVSRSKDRTKEGLGRG